MSRLDRHVSAVQGKLGLSILLRSLAWVGIGLAAAVWLVVLINRLVGFGLPRPYTWLWAGLGAAVALALAYAIWRRPTAHQAAATIDEKLALKEKFSTALYVRSSSDPFAIAAVRDAERTADSVSLSRRFPLQWPRAGYGTILSIAAVLLTMQLGHYDLLHRDEQRRKAAAVQEEQAKVRETIKQVLAKIEAAPRGVSENANIQLAKKELEQALHGPIADTSRAQIRAKKALEDVDAIKQKIKENAQFATAQNEMKSFNQMRKPSGENGPVADAHSKIADGKFSEAIDELDTVIKDFDKLEKKKQEEAAKQMQQLANDLKRMGDDPKNQKEMQKQLQQQGANQQMAQQMAKAIQQAANGDKQAQQQVQQMANQLAQQMNQKAGLTQQQQQQINQQVQQMVQQMQGQANAQAQAQQLAAAAQQMAQAMQQAAAQQGNQAQKGQPGAQGQNQQMAQAKQQMQQQLGQMQAMQQAAAAAQAGQGNPGQNPGQNGQNPGQGPKPGGGPGPFAKGDPKANGGANGGPGLGDGGKRPNPIETPYDTVSEVAPSQTDENGKVLASTFVKASSLAGKSKVQLSQIAANAEKEMTDETDQDRVSRQARSVVTKYFETMRKDADAPQK